VRRTQAEGEAQEVEDSLEEEEKRRLKADAALAAARAVAVGAREGSRALQKVDSATRKAILIGSK
jgi:hypothetical protein